MQVPSSGAVLWAGPLLAVSAVCALSALCPLWQSQDGSFSPFPGPIWYLGGGHVPAIYCLFSFFFFVTSSILVPDVKGAGATLR